MFKLGFINYAIAVVGGWNLTGASYDNKNFNVTQDGTPYGIKFSTDGTKMYILGATNRTVYQYSLSTANDISTATYDTVSISISSQQTVPLGLTFSTDGTKMYVIGNTADTAYQYTLTTAWDLSTASYANKSYAFSEDIVPQGLAFNPTGTKMYMAGNANDIIYQYTLSTAWDISTASYDTVSFSVGTQDTVTVDITFNDIGTKMFIMGYLSDTVYQYDLSTGWDLSTASYNSISFGVGTQEGTPRAIGFSSNGTKMYIIGDTNDTVYQYSTV